MRARRRSAVRKNKGLKKKGTLLVKIINLNYDVLVKARPKVACLVGLVFSWLAWLAWLFSWLRAWLAGWFAWLACLVDVG